VRRKPPERCDVSYVTNARRQPLEWVGFGLLTALVATNVLALAFLKSAGPFIGLAVYAVLLWRWERRDYAPAVVGGLAGLGVHVVEVWVSGWSVYPDLIVLNLALPALLVPVARLVNQRERQRNGAWKR
jgi:hypothetical protein